MFQRILLIFGILFLFQETNGSWLEKQAGYFLAPLITPFAQANEKLQTSLNEYKIRNNELKIEKSEVRDRIEQIPEKCQSEELKSRWAAFEKWNFDSCVNLTDDMKFGSELAVKGAEYVSNITKVLGDYGSKILDCPNGEFSMMVPCYNQNLRSLKQQVEQFKNETVPFVHTSVVVSQDMRHDFDNCIGIPETLKGKVEEEIKRVKC